MVIFGVPCVVTKHTGYDVYGEKLQSAGHPEKCAVVKIEAQQQDSTVRVDSGATRGGAKEYRGAAVLLLSKKTTADIDDTIYVPSAGMTLYVTAKRPRYSVMGRLDHYQIEALIEQ